MNASAQISLYPLRAARLTPVLETAIEAAEATGASVNPGPMSTILEGTVDEVFAALRAAFDAAAESGDLVLVATVSNACPTAAASSTDE
jgi:uncharacterized protein YqgV (UPF0045/DUF77 family)